MTVVNHRELAGVRDRWVAMRGPLAVVCRRCRMPVTRMCVTLSGPEVGREALAYHKVRVRDVAAMEPRRALETLRDAYAAMEPPRGSGIFWRLQALRDVLAAWDTLPEYEPWL